VEALIRLYENGDPKPHQEGETPIGCSYSYYVVYIEKFLNIYLRSFSLSSLSSHFPHFPHFPLTFLSLSFISGAFKKRLDWHRRNQYLVDGQVVDKNPWEDPSVPKKAKKWCEVSHLSHRSPIGYYTGLY
jgi:hypothetical protein